MEESSDDGMVFVPNKGLINNSTLSDADLSLMEIKCTACEAKINHRNGAQIMKHPHLSVIICKNCFKFYGNGKFTRDDSGVDEYCRWCADGGRLLGCDDCNNAFCLNCIRRNKGRKEANRILQSSKWKCYCCDPKPLEGHVGFCERIFTFVKNAKDKKSKTRKKETSSDDSEDSSPTTWADPLFSQADQAVSALKKQMKKLQFKFNLQKNDPSSVYQCSRKLKRLLSKHRRFMEYLLVDIKGAMQENVSEENQESEHLNAEVKSGMDHTSDAELSDGEVTLGLRLSSPEDDIADNKDPIKEDKESPSLLDELPDLSNDLPDLPQNSSEHSTAVKNDSIESFSSDSEVEGPTEEGASAEATSNKRTGKLIDKSTSGKFTKRKVPVTDNSETVLSEDDPEITFPKSIKSVSFEVNSKNSKLSKDDKGKTSHSSKCAVGKTVTFEHNSAKETSNKDVQDCLNEVVGSVSDITNGELKETENSVHLLLSSDSDSSESNDGGAESHLQLDSTSPEPESMQLGPAKDSNVENNSSGNEDLVNDENKASDISSEEEQNIKAKQLLIKEMMESTPTKKSKKRRRSSVSSSSSSEGESIQSEIEFKAMPDIETDTKLNSDAVVVLQKINVSGSDVFLCKSKNKSKTKSKKEKKAKCSLSRSTSDDSISEEIAKLAAIPKNKKHKKSSKGTSNSGGSDSSDDFVQTRRKTTKKASPKKIITRNLISSDSDDSDSDSPKTKPVFNKKVNLSPKSKNDMAKDTLLFDVSDSLASSDSDVIPLTPKQIKKSKENKEKNSKLLKSIVDNSSDSSDDFVKSKKYSKYDKILKVPINKKDKKDAGRSKSKGEKETSKKNGKKTKRRKVISDSNKSGSSSSSSSSSSSESESESSDHKPVQKGKKRKRIQTPKNSDDSDVQELPDTPSNKGRKNIRKLIGDKELGMETKKATVAENERRERVKARQKLYNQVTEEGGDFGEQVTRKLVLEVDPITKEDLVEVPAEIIGKLKPHQVDGVKFMWESLIESLAQLEKNHKGSGCVLAHCMGLGKTLQVIALVSTLLNNPRINKKIRTVLIVCPYNTIRNWKREFEIWLEDTDSDIEVFEMANIKGHHERSDVLSHWHKIGGAMIMSYDTFRSFVSGKRIPKKCKAVYERVLLDPGPDLVICDEGHVLKNTQTALSKAMSQIRTARRVVLTGTPLQNNLIEYHCMIQFVKPHLVGTKVEFQNRFVSPISNGQCADSTPKDVKLMKKRVHILHKLLEGCVQRCDYSHVTKYLPPKYEFVISVRLSESQISLYRWYLNHYSGAGSKNVAGSNGDNPTEKPDGACLFKDYNILKLIWTHPYLLKMQKKRADLKAFFEEDSMSSFINDNSDSESEAKASTAESEKGKEEVVCLDASPKPKASTSKPRGNKKGDDSDEDEVVSNWKTKSRGGEKGASESEGEDDTINGWWSEFVPDDDLMKIELSGKMVLLFEILKECELVGDKVLLFTQSLLALDLMEELLQSFSEEIRLKPETKTADMLGTWVNGLDYFRMDGSTSADVRKKCIDTFNHPENERARLFMISTKAGSLGTNMVGANRVVMLDTSWNPTHDVQAIFRVYRFGQKKPVYVYRLLAQGTMEEKIYDRQVTKQSLASRVVDEHQIERHFNAADLIALYSFNPDSKTNRPTPMVPKDRLLAELLIKEGVKDLIVTFHEHDSLLENISEEGLTEDERKVAWAEYEVEREGLLNSIPTVHMTFENEFLREIMDEDKTGDLRQILLTVKEGQPAITQQGIMQAIMQLNVMCERQLKELEMVANNLIQNKENVPKDMEFNMERIEKLYKQTKSVVDSQKKRQSELQEKQRQENQIRMEAQRRQQQEFLRQQTFQARQQGFNAQQQRTFMAQQNINANGQAAFAAHLKAQKMYQGFQGPYRTNVDQNPNVTIGMKQNPGYGKRGGATQNFTQRPAVTTVVRGPVITEVRDDEPGASASNNKVGPIITEITEID